MRAATYRQDIYISADKGGNPAVAFACPVLLGYI